MGDNSPGIAFGLVEGEAGVHSKRGFAGLLFGGEGGRLLQFLGRGATHPHGRLLSQFLHNVMQIFDLKKAGSGISSRPLLIGFKRYRPDIIRYGVWNQPYRTSGHEVGRLSWMGGSSNLPHWQSHARENY